MSESNISPKSRGVALALAVAVPCMGLHRFYVGRIGTGILQILTLGGLGIWWIYDLITLSAGSFRDKMGKRMKYWTEDDAREALGEISGEFSAAEIVDELYALRNEVAELAERVDFTERLLSRGKEPHRYEESEQTPA